MSGKILKRALALCLCMLLLAGSCLAEDSLEDFVPDALTEEELAQWQEWAEEGMGDSDATAANAAELTPEEESLMAEMASMLEDTTVSTEVDLSNLEPNEALPDYVVNILLLGVDNRSVELVSGRADANIICSINTQDGSIKLTSIARDTAEEVPGYKSKKTPEHRLQVRQQGRRCCKGRRAGHEDRQPQFPDEHRALCRGQHSWAGRHHRGAGRRGHGADQGRGAGHQL